MNGSAINATREISRDGTSAYLASLHTSAERFFLNNLLVLGGAMLLVVALHLAAIRALRRRTRRQGHKWHGAPAALIPTRTRALARTLARTLALALTPNP